jgi:hypothetical protein
MLGVENIKLMETVIELHPPSLASDRLGTDFRASQSEFSLRVRDSDSFL